MKILNFTRLIPALLMPVMAAVTISCSSEQKGDTSNTLEFETYEFKCVAEDMCGFDEGVEPTEADSIMRYVYFSGSGVLPKDIGNSEIKILRDSLLSMAGVEYLSATEVRPSLDSCYNLTDRTIKIEDGYSSFSSALSVNLINTKVVVWECLNKGYMYQAAHGMYRTEYLNYSIEKNSIINIGDVLKADSMKDLVNLLNVKLREKDVELFNPSSEVEMPYDFEITSSGINFIWGLYSIAPYSEGEVTVSVNSYEIVDMLTDFGRSLFKF